MSLCSTVWRLAAWSYETVCMSDQSSPCHEVVPNSQHSSHCSAKRCQMGQRSAQQQGQKSEAGAHLGVERGRPERRQGGDPGGGPDTTDGEQRGEAGGARHGNRERSDVCTSSTGGLFRPDADATDGRQTADGGQGRRQTGHKNRSPLSAKFRSLPATRFDPTTIPTVAY